MIATSEYGGRYFLCGGFKNFIDIGGYSPCYELKNRVIVRKSNMKNMRMYFSLICLTKYEKFQRYNTQDNTDKVKLNNS